MPNTYDLAGKSAVVTGAAKGIGRATAELLVANGCRVTAWDASRADVPGATSMTVDITERAQVDAALRSADGGRVDILVNSAGVLGPATSFADQPAEVWRRIVEVDLVGTMQVTQAVVPLMVRQGGGRIVNLGSLAGKEGVAGIAAYSAASAGIIAFTKALGRELVRDNVFVNCVAPGPIDTDMIRGMGAEGAAQMLRDSPMGRLGTASEVAHLIVWLCTEASRYQTSAVFDISGGRARY